MNTRVERDSMGTMDVPADALYGASTQRAVLNFPISDLRLQPAFIRALAYIKYAAAEVNQKNGHLDNNVAEAIKSAAQEIINGKHHDQFVVDVFQTGSGTSTNMNANEVIANLAIQKLGGKLGDRGLVHPNDHVNQGMSSNDAIPTAIHIAGLLEIRESLRPGLDTLLHSLKQKSEEFWPVIKTGRTHLQDATPIRLGQEFQGYVGQVQGWLQMLDSAEQALSVVALGGTAVGTGINTQKQFPQQCLDAIAKMTGLHLREASNHFQAQSTIDMVVLTSGILKTIAASLMKIANDIRWLGSGPRAGIGEIALPEVQPGSSIMPGKVNPVIAESVCMVCAQVIGNDVTVTIAGQAGNFELNVMLPVAAFNLLQSINFLGKVCENFAKQTIDGLKATDKGPDMVERGLALCTALVPSIGYDKAAAISKEAAKSGRTIREVAREQTNLSEEQLSEILDPFKMTEPES